MDPEDLPLASQFLSEARTGFQDGGMVGSYLEPYEPTLRERVQYRIADFLINHGMDPYAANRRARNVVGDPDLDFSAPGAMGLADLTPVGSIFGLPEAWRTVRRGLNTGDALTTGAGALEGILSLADTIPLVGGIVARAANPLVRRGTREAAGALEDVVDDPARRRLMQGAAAMALLPPAFGDDLADIASAVARRTPTPPGSGSLIFDNILRAREAESRLQKLMDDYPDPLDPPSLGILRQPPGQTDVRDRSRDEAVELFRQANPEADLEDIKEYVDEIFRRKDYFDEFDTVGGVRSEVQEENFGLLMDSLHDAEGLTDEMLDDLRYPELVDLYDNVSEAVGYLTDEYPDGAREELEDALYKLNIRIQDRIDNISGESPPIRRY